MKKVLFVATVASHIESFHLPYLKLFKDNGFKTYVVANWNIEDKEKIDYVDEFISIPIQRTPYSIKNLKAIKQLKKIINENNFEIIHCHTPVGGVLTRIAAKKARKKGTRVIYTAHGFHFYKGAPLTNWLIFYPVEKYLSKYTDCLITINQEDYELAKRKFKKCKQIELVHGVGIDERKFDFEMPEGEKINLRETLGLRKSDFVLTCVARLDKNKNQIFLIQCMKKLVKKKNNIHLLLVGRDELNGKYQKMVNKLNLKNNVHFLGNRSDVPQLLKISDVVVSASKREGLPVNIIEAFVSGVPVVALECRGMKDLIVDGENGYIVYNEEKFIDTILLKINSQQAANKVKPENYGKFSIKSILFFMLRTIYKL